MKNLKPENVIPNPEREFKNKKYPYYEMQREIKIRAIATDIVNGMTKRNIIHKYKELWNISEAHVRECYNEALVTMTDEEGLARLREVNTERLLDLYKAACDKGDIASQLKAIDLINRTNSIYRTNINLGDSTEFVFNFGQAEQDEDQTDK